MRKGGGARGRKLAQKLVAKELESKKCAQSWHDGLGDVGERPI